MENIPKPMVQRPDTVDRKLVLEDDFVVFEGAGEPLDAVLEVLESMLDVERVVEGVVELEGVLALEAVLDELLESSAV
jgi:hypothetical protein